LANKDELAAYKLELAKSLIPVFKDRATEEKPLMDILCEQCGKYGIQQGDETYNALLKACLTNSALENVPLLAADIQKGAIEIVRASNDPDTNPDPEFCQKVMQAESIETMAHQFSTFFNEKMANETDPEKRKYYQARKRSLCGGALCDIPRELGPIELKIGDQQVKITLKDSSLSSAQQQGNASNEADYVMIFKALFNQIKTQSDLSDKDALDVTKQFLLNYRGNNTATGASLLADFNQENGADLALKYEGFKTTMYFDNQDGSFRLSEKVESEILYGIMDTSNDGKFITSDFRFKFSDDTEIRTGLPVTSTRIPTDDGTIQWSCLLRENPPKKVIFYGGCQPPPPSAN
jgi:hypothetical protein